MGYDAIIRRRDGQSLGDVSDVQQKLEAVFSGAKFAVQHRPPDVRPEAGTKTRGEVLALHKPGLINRLALLIHRLFFSSDVQYPYTEGYFEGDAFAITFFLGSQPSVGKVHITLYGPGDPEPYFSRLIAETGWEVRWPRF